MRSIRVINPSPHGLTKTCYFTLTPDDFTRQGRASGWERVVINWDNLPISLP